MTKIINTTPHDIHVVDGKGAAVKTYPASGMTIRLSARTEEVGLLDGVRLTRTVYGEPVLVTPEGERALPAPEEGVWIIVSSMVKAALGNRADLLVPAEQVRDDQGKIVGCRSLGL